jgi:hypothetical protein
MISTLPGNSPPTCISPRSEMGIQTKPHKLMLIEILYVSDDTKGRNSLNVHQLLSDNKI